MTLDELKLQVKKDLEVDDETLGQRKSYKIKNFNGQNT